MNDVYVVVLEDRHIDDCIEVFMHRIDAFNQIAHWASDYKNETWVEEKIEGWEYYIHSECDDGPQMRIEKKKLRQESPK